MTNLKEFGYIEKDDKPFIQKIADRLHKELSSDNLETKLAAIWTLPNYLDNKAIKNKNVMVNSLKQLLTDSNWKVRVVTYKALSYVNLLPPAHRLSYTDKLYKLILGEPEMI